MTRQNGSKCFAPPCRAAVLLLTTAISNVGATEPVDARFVPLDLKASQVQLDACATQLRAAVEAVRTWEGKISIVDVFTFSDLPVPKEAVAGSVTEDKTSRPGDGSASQAEMTILKGKVEAERKAEAKFWFDGETNSIFSEYQSIGPTKYLHKPTQKRFGMDSIIRMKAIVRPDGLYTMYPDEVAGEMVGFPRSVTDAQPFTRIVKREPAENAKQLRTHSILVDPSIALEEGGHRLDALLTRYAEQMLKPEVAKVISVWQSSDKSELLVRKNYLIGQSTDGMTVEFVLNLKNSSLPVSSREFMNDGRVLLTADWEYEVADGQTVPSKYVRVQYSDDGELSSRREFRYTGSVVNAPISKERFDLASLELKDGERVVDRVANRLYKMDDGQLVLATNVMKESTTKSSGRPTMTLIMVNVIAVLLFVVVLAVRKLRSTAAN